MDAPVEDLYRATSRIEARAVEGATMPTLEGYFCVFNRWTEISSWYEGNFLESIAVGSADKTIREQGDRVRCLYDHGYDPTIGNKPLGPFEELKGDKTGVRYAVPLMETSYNQDFIVPAVSSVPAVLGASFRFRVIADTWNDDPGVSEHNPKGLPERVITEFRLFEGGPVTFPAYPDGTTPSLRSLTDHYIERALGIEDLLGESPLALRALERWPLLRTLAGASPGATTRAASPATAPDPHAKAPTTRYQALARLAALPKEKAA
jgi:HK97 family phage prohead protease